MDAQSALGWASFSLRPHCEIAPGFPGELWADAGSNLQRLVRPPTCRVSAFTTRPEISPASRATENGKLCLVFRQSDVSDVCSVPSGPHRLCEISDCLSVYPPACLAVCLPTRQSVRLSVYPPACLSPVALDSTEQQCDKHNQK